MRKEHKYSELTGQIIGCAMKVHSALGNGFQEVIYQRALEIELADQDIPYQPRTCHADLLQRPKHRDETGGFPGG